MTHRSMGIAASAAGGAMLAGSLLAGRLALSASGGVSEGRLLLGVFGILLLGAGVAGKRLPVVWLGFGRLLLCGCCAALLWLTLTVFARAAVRREPATPLLEPGMVPGVEYPLTYTPHVLWTLPGSYPANLQNSPVRVYGDLRGNPDSLLEAMGVTPGIAWADRRQPGYNSTQSLILLMLDLRGNPPPETVVLTAGMADLLAALDTGDPVWPLGSGSFLAATGSSHDLSMDMEGSELALGVARVQLVNRAVLQALAAEYGFRAGYVWLPGECRAFPEHTLVDSIMASPTVPDTVVEMN